MICTLLIPLLLGLASPSVRAEEMPKTEPAAADPHEPIPYFERYQPSFFLAGKPNTKVQLSFKVQAFRDVPVYLGYTQLMIWHLFRASAPIREMNYSPEVFYRIHYRSAHPTYIDLGPFQHESNGIGSSDSRSWNRSYIRVFQSRMNGIGAVDRRVGWSAKVWLPWGMSEPASRKLPRYRGLWEFQFSISDLFEKIFDVNELLVRIYGGGSSRINPLQGGQELTYREKVSSRKFLLPLYFQVFHGYGENLLDAGDKHWGFRAGIGF
jgi:phospholipase A1